MNAYRAMSSAILFAAGEGYAAQTVPPVKNPCERPMAGSVIRPPPALYSSNHALNVNFSYQHVFDALGRGLFCFMTPDGLQNPTLHVNPGDLLIDHG
jgi:hypothetical protein